MMSIRNLFALAVGLTCTASAVAAPGAPLQFNRDIRPLLSDNCLACHGPDSAHRKASLRLDTQEGLFGKREDGIAVVPGKPAESIIWSRIITTDADDLMPPPDSHKKLTPAQKATIKRWIEEGASWEPHWSLKAPVRPAAPAVKTAKWVRNAIDAFVLAKMEAAGLSPAVEADRRTLARRLSFDLIGLPPSPEEVEAFATDPSPNAYEAYVDMLLAKPQWGEHRGRYWLDAARYGDTHGIHNDNYREMWAYRDWVIDAFNRNLRFDQFVTEQVAGDLLPNRTLETQIASGFQRCNITTSEGGSIPDEVQAMYDKDRVETTATVFLGLTMGCAACHDHKFDPISQRDFYSMAAFFRNTTQPAMDGNKPDTPPIIVVPNAEDRPRWEKLTQTLTELTAAKKTREGEANKPFEDWLKAGEHRKLTAPLAITDELFAADFDEGTGAASTDIAGKAGTLGLPAGVSWSDGQAKGQKAIKFADKASIELSEVKMEPGQAFSIGAWVLVPPEEGTFVIASKIDPKAKTPTTGWALSIETRVPSFRIFGKGGKKLEIRGNSSSRPQSGKWVHLLVSYDGSGHPSGLTMHINGKPEFPDYSADSAPLAGVADRNDQPVRLGTDGKRYLTNGALADVRIFGRKLLVDEAAAIQKWSALKPALVAKNDKLSPAQKADLKLLYLVRQDESYRDISHRISVAEAGQREINKRSAITHVMAEKPNTPAMARILFRGQYDQPKDEVMAMTPAALHPYPKDGPQNRLGLARWIIDPANPLTSRVTVNRLWQEVFGTGIVRTSEDFGIMGENPSHPELLDWLAVEFRAPADGAPGGDFKKFFKMLVMSATYRQAAIATPEKLVADPQNRLLSRGPRFRMDAEVLRDFALASSGLLVKKIGGPSVKPYQPPGVWEAVAMKSSNTRDYKEDTGEGLYRRSMYWFWKRSAPPASMDLMNAPTREVCTVRRERTNTPMQALVTMNDPQWVEAARHLAERTLKEAGNSFDARLDFVTQRLISRKLSDRERQICRTSFNDFAATYAVSEEEAKKLIATGASTPDEKLPPAELATWTMLASQLMNLDEALNK
ncbi:DUF1553 domain-containing protein [Humisphaera borealis]|uniref:DUF1553 domain-containing protein n=1 Tax=Humisphaera borealis TaxID=2807512 RepID=A0A7M2WST3_9BACT|nr:DUF1553 domain-containing protein [Humisphaera borealis]QOV88493.1 DUF1553 domain-containing protein [Humisphaera borealis]